MARRATTPRAFSFSRVCNSTILNSVCHVKLGPQTIFGEEHQMACHCHSCGMLQLPVCQEETLEYLSWLPLLMRVKKHDHRDKHQNTSYELFLSCTLHNQAACTTCLLLNFDSNGHAPTQGSKCFTLLAESLLAAEYAGW